MVPEKQNHRVHSRTRIAVLGVLITILVLTFKFFNSSVTESEAGSGIMFISDQVGVSDKSISDFWWKAWGHSYIARGSMMQITSESMGTAIVNVYSRSELVESSVSITLTRSAEIDFEPTNQPLVAKGVTRAGFSGISIRSVAGHITTSNNTSGYVSGFIAQGTFYRPSGTLSINNFYPMAFYSGIDKANDASDSRVAAFELAASSPDWHYFCDRACGEAALARVARFMTFMFIALETCEFTPPGLPTVICNSFVIGLMLGMIDAIWHDLQSCELELCNHCGTATTYPPTPEPIQPATTPVGRGLFEIPVGRAADEYKTLTDGQPQLGSLVLGSSSSFATPGSVNVFGLTQYGSAVSVPYELIDAYPIEIQEGPSILFDVVGLEVTISGNTNYLSGIKTRIDDGLTVEEYITTMYSHSSSDEALLVMDALSRAFDVDNDASPCEKKCQETAKSDAEAQVIEHALAIAICMNSMPPGPQRKLCYVSSVADLGAVLNVVMAARRRCYSACDLDDCPTPYSTKTSTPTTGATSTSTPQPTSPPTITPGIGGVCAAATPAVMCIVDSDLIDAWEFGCALGDGTDPACHAVRCLCYKGNRRACNAICTSELRPESWACLQLTATPAFPTPTICPAQ